MVIIGLGSEIVECVRISKMIEQHGELFLNRVYTAEEIFFCSQRAEANQHYAARWAAKEAVLLSMGTTRNPGIRWPNIEICGKPSCGYQAILHGEARRRAMNRSIDTILITLAHCRTYATATAIAIQDE